VDPMLRCQATPSIRALGSNQPVHFVPPVPNISCCYVTGQESWGGVDSCRRKALYPFFLQVTLQFRLCLLLFFFITPWKFVLHTWYLFNPRPAKVSKTYVRMPRNHNTVVALIFFRPTIQFNSNFWGSTAQSISTS